METPKGIDTLLLNLERFVRLSEDDRRSIAALRSAPLLTVPPRTDIIREGDQPDVVRLMVSGWASRYKDLPDGRRQIVGFFIPGDFCDLNVYILQTMDHSIGALTAVSYLAIQPDILEQLTHSRPRIAQALLWHELVSFSIMREWLLSLGQRSALERIGHLIVELYMRMRGIGQARDGTFDFPITQADLAEATGLTQVHVNRTLQELRREGLIELSRRKLRILDFDRLRQLAVFNPNYLHLDHEGHRLDAND